MLLTVLYLIAGLMLLLAGGNYLVEGGVSIATRLKMSPLLIGMTIVAFGTSAPELLVSLKSAVIGNSGIALGNVIGSNIVNIGFILGLTAIISPIITQRKSITYNGLVMIASVCLFMLFACTRESLSRTEGFVMFAALVAFLVVSVFIEKKGHRQEESKSAQTDMPIWIACFVVVGSCFALSYGADLLIDSATKLAKAMNVSDRVIGLTIVSVGTSLPELAASLIAAIKKQMDISIGNIIGSNIFNILCVLGVSSAVVPIQVDWSIYLKDSLYMAGFSIMLVAFTIKSGKLGRLGGLILLAAYVYYTKTLFF